MVKEQTKKQREEKEFAHIMRARQEIEVCSNCGKYSMKAEIEELGYDGLYLYCECMECGSRYIKEFDITKRREYLIKDKGGE